MIILDSMIQIDDESALFTEAYLGFITQKNAALYQSAGLIVSNALAPYIL